MSADLHVMQARLTPSPRSDRERAAVHDFRDTLTELVMAVNEGDNTLARHLMGTLTRAFEEAVLGPLKTRAAE